MKMTTLKSVAIAVGLTSSAFGQAANSVTDDDVDFSSVLAAGTYILEIEDATGVLQVVDTFAGGVITTPDDLSATVTAGVSYTIRPISTIASVFGETNSAGLTGGPSAATSDVIFVPDGAGGFNEFFFFNGNILVANTNPLSPATAAEVELPHDQGVLIQSPNANSVVISGDLKVTNTSFPLLDNTGALLTAGSDFSVAVGTFTDPSASGDALSFSDNFNIFGQAAYVPFQAVAGPANGFLDLAILGLSLTPDGSGASFIQENVSVIIFDGTDLGSATQAGDRHICDR